MLRKTSVAIAKLNAIETPSGTISSQCWWKNKALNTFSDCKLLFLLLSFTLCANEWMSDLAFLHLCQVKLIACNSIQLKEITRQRPRCACILYIVLPFICHCVLCVCWNVLRLKLMYLFHKSSQSRWNCTYTHGKWTYIWVECFSITLLTQSPFRAKSANASLDLACC